MHSFREYQWIFSAMDYSAVFIVSLKVTKHDIFSGKLLFMKFLQRCLDLLVPIHFCSVTFFPGALVHSP